MNIRDLTYLVAVGDLHHFGKAAEQCCVSQPTLSGQIKKLEEQLDVKLFERTKRRVVPTDIGLTVIASARRILREVDVIYTASECAHDPLGGKFRLGAFPTLATYVFPQLVQKIKIVMPNLRPILIEEKTAVLIDKLKAGEIDAALLALPVHDDFLVSHKLFDDAFYLAVPPDHQLASANTINQDVLASYRLLLLEEGHCMRDQALAVCQLHGIGEEQDFKATGMETLRQMVKVGTGITFMPEIAIRENEVGIEYIPFEKPSPTRTIGIVWRKTSTRKPIIDKIISEMTMG